MEILNYIMMIKIIFEGEYLYNHKRRGKKYFNGKLNYEGEYLYDQKGTEKDMMKMVK